MRTPDCAPEDPRERLLSRAGFKEAQGPPGAPTPPACRPSPARSRAQPRQGAANPVPPVPPVPSRRGADLLCKPRGRAHLASVLLHASKFLSLRA